MQKLYSYDNFSLNSTDSLQKRVFFEYMYYFCNQGCETFVMCKKMTELKRDSKGLRYVRVKVKRQTKNHRGDDLTDHDDKDGRMFEIPGNKNANLV